MADLAGSPAHIHTYTHTHSATDFGSLSPHATHRLDKAFFKLFLATVQILACPIGLLPWTGNSTAVIRSRTYVIHVTDKGGGLLAPKPRPWQYVFFY